ncbi:hypothetical protein NVV94_13025 [Pseudomonas sp. LS1212]|nr:hypothetical protein NVV94_13025 [Pseudomonas sp. LS1212]
MSESLQTAAQLTHHAECELTALHTRRAQLKAAGSQISLAGPAAIPPGEPLWSRNPADSVSVSMRQSNSIASWRRWPGRQSSYSPLAANGTDRHRKARRAAGAHAATAPGATVRVAQVAALPAQTEALRR